MNKRMLRILTTSLNKLCESLEFKIELFLAERPWLLEFRGEEVKTIKKLEMEKWENKVRIDQLVVEIENILLTNNDKYDTYFIWG